eukprot:TRINITY_DN26720_c0_g1_i1.p1 TRINITY_DN26720_c0_g1~~TRINITY_DN26720_c0_g1_i1.p1  ORF type:complete len:435 (-),score=99.29 TRINITY_DN26720_c0_g1_i1:77-1381(-)
MACVVNRMSTSRFFENPNEKHHTGYDVYNDAAVEISKSLLELQANVVAQVDQHRLSELIGLIRSRWPPSASISDDESVYTGHAGIAFMFVRLLEHATSSQQRTLYSDLALAYTEAALSCSHVEHPGRHRLTFAEGCLAGPYALAAIVYHLRDLPAVSERYQAKLLSLADQALSTDMHSDELLYGRAGYLYALLLVGGYVGGTGSWAAAAASVVQRLADSIVHRGRTLGQQRPDRAPLMYEWHGKAYLGGAHGLSGILYVLLQAGPAVLARHADTLRASADYLAAMQFAASGNFPSAADSGSRDELVQWCHGSPSASMLFAKCYQVFGQDKYLHVAERAADNVWHYGLLRKGTGLCHGVSGNGYVFLHLFAATKQVKYLARALAFCEFIWSDNGKKTWSQPDNPFSLFEGLAGAVCFISDCCRQASTARMPGFDV